MALAVAEAEPVGEGDGVGEGVMTSGGEEGTTGEGSGISGEDGAGEGTGDRLVVVSAGRPVKGQEVREEMETVVQEEVEKVEVERALVVVVIAVMEEELQVEKVEVERALVVVVIAVTEEEVEKVEVERALVVVVIAVMEEEERVVQGVGEKVAVEKVQEVGVMVEVTMVERRAGKLTLLGLGQWLGQRLKHLLIPGQVPVPEQVPVRKSNKSVSLFAID
ncbi:hypothetical protein CEUSTIGMA_g11002.t1 [Chlamydomonas eustigma]|uniref:Uncharacterized protein n=1 Tax=Chlamydomonas eustigma TaxID=1157962 RepID=A0A250XKJ6_9CHLO|nr:hypothetical protein CEUSTIGMA_g11002.t1 [Chlamydomonas eustigma]|eukprot:GAX83577.1 hypothetical protein CEUSTIGMA_g11002.t1 [Chlamydomonas eustigma]